jgi:hypothetical protein
MTKEQLKEPERIIALTQKCGELRNKIYDWNTVTEEEDRSYAEELQMLYILDQMLVHIPVLLTDAGLDYVDECLAKTEEWINEKMEEQGDE